MVINKCCNYTWPIDYKNSINREETIRVTLRSLFFYLIFLIIATTVIISMIPPLVYTFTTIIKGQFIDVEFASDDKEPIVFDDIRTVKDFWAYLSIVAIPNIYSSKWASPISKNSTKDNKTLLVENAVLGVPRLRQLRVRDDSCEIHKHFQGRFNRCFGIYSKSNEDKSDDKDFIYNSSNSYLLYFGSVSIYGAGGYKELLNNTKEESLQKLVHLYQEFWITQSTRVVFLDFTLYNPNLNLFCIVKLIFEFPPSGGVLTSSSFLTVNLMRYDKPRDFIIMGLEFVYMCYIFYFIIQEMRNCNFYGRKYCTFLWSHVNIFIIFGSIILIPFNTYKFLFVPIKIKEISENPDEFAHMEFIAFCQWVINNIEAMLLFLIWIKIFRFLNLSSAMGQLETTLRRCGNEIIIFSLMFFVVFLSFAQMGYLLFGEQNNHFSAFAKSLMTLLITILGDFDYYAIERDNKIIAPIFLSSYIFLVFFVLFNMFLAIITGTFANVKDDIKTEKSELSISAFLLRLPKNLVKRCFPQFAAYFGKKRNLKLGNYETISEIRRILKLCNFSNTEIERFFDMYDIDENGYNSDDRVNWMLNDIKSFKPTPDDCTKKDNSTMKSFSRCKFGILYRYFCQERFDSLNIQFSNLSENMDKLRTQLEKFKNS